MRPTTYPLQALRLTVSGWVHRHQASVIRYLVEENRVLREQHRSHALRLNDDQRRRLAAKARSLGRDTLERIATIVTPDTLVRWHRRLIAAKWTHPGKRVGRRGLMKAIAALIVRMASDNPSWGYCRIQGELRKVGHRVAPSTIANVLEANGVRPAPDRPLSWRTFLRAHWGQVAATDFFSVEVWSRGRLTTFYVLFFVELKCRRVHVAGITRNPTDWFMGQATWRARTFLEGCRYVIHDRDTKYSLRFRTVMEDSGIETIRTPLLAPNANAYAERFVRSIKSECLDRMIFIGEDSLRRTIDEYLAHDHRERPHQGIENECIAGDGVASNGDIVCDERLGGLLKSYRRAA